MRRDTYAQFLNREQAWSRAALDAINTKDLPIISATVLISAAFIVTANIVVDIVYSVIDPRVRLS